MKHLFFMTIAMLTVLGQPSMAQQSNTKFGQNEMLEDLDYLYKSLIDAHYNIYAYVDKKDFESNYRMIRSSIDNDSITLLDATNIFQRVISAANNGHTEIDFPISSYITYANAGGTLFPLELAFEDDKSLIRKNFSNNQEIKIGSEVKSINGMSMSDVLSKINPQISAERRYFKNAKIEMYSFPRFYWQVFGKQDEFEVEIFTEGKVKKFKLNAVDLIEGYETKRSEVTNAKMKLEFRKNIAYLNPGDFSGDEQQYQQFIDSSFFAIKNKGNRDLIIDLRNNRGGNDSFSDYLVSYFANKPFKWSSNFTLKTSQFLKEHTRKNSDTTKTYFKEILSHKNGEVYSPELGYFQPQEKSKRFLGNVYVLVNRQSYSQATVTAAQIQDYGFGIIVGEETGEYPSLYASQFQYTLPNTSVVVKVSKGYITRVNGSTAKKGVIPDMVIQDHLLDEEDEILTGLLDKLN